ncbi:hypothetical protein GGTG_04841 [Gaeumannomyces tritici R3-111a-1]|uniref:Uncharacterized protein n=1 Tax=Gaeumannomyces tritici (strain R3-111a-1) TaxID=644352 RepID=J3NU86_GAET3|nr:hypothetical protein GGTG_04841 [Gaeumannomyces tritici R3-111a-1]EJT79757.1 hypothetical protein GGTG_04841 [Gaeumannomyces tritici R3-111a-1]
MAIKQSKCVIQAFYVWAIRITALYGPGKAIAFRYKPFSIRICLINKRQLKKVILAIIRFTK